MRTDKEIKQDVLAELDWEPKVDASHIGVVVRNGSVDLTGHVTSFPEKLAAEKTSLCVKGVRAVANEIEVRLADQNKVADDEIAEAISSILAWTTRKPTADIRAVVRRGFVTLSGEVGWQHEKAEVANQIRHLKGVIDVVSLVKVRPSASPKNVKREITRALHRNAQIEASHIDLEIEGGKVVIKGEVRSNREGEVVRNAVWSAPGVEEVIDELSLSTF